MIYMDNAATSYPKPDSVYEEMCRCMRTYCANPGRGGHNMSIASGKAVFEARETISGFFNIRNPLRMCFTKNATEAINMALIGVLKPGDHVVTTSMEHNSVIRPLKTMERDLNIKLTIIKADSEGAIDVKSLKKNIRKETRLIACTLSSNVNGIIFPIKQIGEVARENGIIFLVDAAQGAGSLEVDVEEMKIDLLAFPGHKGLLGPQGTGGLFVRENVRLRPVFQGGTGSNSENIYQPEFMPDALESGTLNTPGIVGLCEGVRFIKRAGIGFIKSHKQMLINKFTSGIKGIKGIRRYSPGEADRNSGIIALNIEGCDSTEISDILDREYGIATRAGLHCAPLAHQTLETYSTGVVRFSMGCFNNAGEIDFVLDALERISHRMHRHL